MAYNNNDFAIFYSLGHKREFYVPVPISTPLTTIMRRINTPFTFAEPGTTPALESQLPSASAIDAQVSLEGLFEGLGQLFKRDPNRKLNKQRNPDGHFFRSAQNWSRTFKDAIGKTYANPAWVEEHLRKRTHTNHALSRALSYQGRHLKTPLAMLKKGVQIRDEFFGLHRQALANYGHQLQDLHEDITHKSDYGLKDEALWLYGLAQAGHLDKPFHRGVQGPLWFGGVYPVFGRSRPVHDSLPAEAAGALPVLTVADVVEAAEYIVEISYHAGQNIEAFLEESGAFGIDTSHDDFWDEEEEEVIEHDPGTGTKRRRTVERDPHPHSVLLKRVFEEDAAEQCQLVLFYVHATYSLCADLGRWFYAVTTEVKAK